MNAANKARTSRYGSWLVLFGLSVNALGLSLVPRPVEMETDSGQLRLDAGTRIHHEGEDTRPIAALLAEEMREATGLALPVVAGKEAADHGILLTTRGAEPALGEEGYELTVAAGGVTVRAPAPAGLFYGTRTLLQLLPPRAAADTASTVSPAALPHASIRDYPRFRWRGMMLDVSRYFFNKEFVKRYLDMMAAHKLNVLHFHLTDDPGWRVEIEAYPKLTEVGAWRGEGENRHGGFYTRSDIRELVAYAAARQIMIVPEIEFPAHNRAAVAAYPELSCAGGPFEVPTKAFISKDLFCAGQEETYTFLFKVLDEVCELFPAPYVHIGGDEANYERWKACERCQQTLRDQGLENEHALQSYMTRRVQAHLKAKDRSLVGWDELMECGLPEKAMLMSWHRPSTAVDAARAGNDVVMALTDHCYFDAPESRLPGEPKAATWIPPVPLQRAYTWDPIPSELIGREARHIVGVEGCMWSDRLQIHYDELGDPPGQGTRKSERYIEYLTLPRLSALAEVAWTPQADRGWEDFQQRMKTHYLRYADAGWNYRVPLPEWREQGDHVTLDAPVAGARVRYTLDGTAPGSDAQVYAEPIPYPFGRTLTAVTEVDAAARSLALVRIRNIPKKDWKVVFASSENEGEEAARAIDEDPDTLWHSRWEGGAEPYPHEMRVDLGQTFTISGLTYLPRKGNVNGVIDTFEVYVSQDGSQWGEPEAGGSLGVDLETRAQVVVSFGRTVKGRYLRFVALSEVKGQAFAAAAEIGIVLAPDPE